MWKHGPMPESQAGQECQKHHTEEQSQLPVLGMVWQGAVIGPGIKDMTWE